jgi:hypothetical protein
MTDGGRSGIEQPVWQEFWPFWMLKGNKAHAPAEGFKNGLLFDAFTVFTQCEQIHSVFACQFPEQMKRALVGSTIYGERDVGVDDEDVHGFDFRSKAISPSACIAHN